MPRDSLLMRFKSLVTPHTSSYVCAHTFSVWRADNDSTTVLLVCRKCQSMLFRRIEPDVLHDTFFEPPHATLGDMRA